MPIEIHNNASRGHFNHGWLSTYHSFSFASYYNPQRMGFGQLLVINDDTIIGGAGFGTHSHKDMEIITIPLSGALAHKDSTGTEEVIRAGEIQIMSAGTGIAHSEYNYSSSEKVTLLQIWVRPHLMGIKPRYQQKKFDLEMRKNAWQTIVSPEEIAQTEEQNSPVWINQNAYFHLCDLDKNQDLDYCLKMPGNSLFLFLIEGKIDLSEKNLQKTLSRRDAAAISDVEKVSLHSQENSQILLMEIPK